MNNILSKYEKTTIISLRAKQIEQGAPSTIKTNETDALRIAQAELRAGTLPLKIQRTMPNGTIIYFNLNEMIIE